MNTVHELIKESAQTQEHAMSRIERPSLHRRVKRTRAVRHARVAVGATVGVGALALGSALVVPTLWSADQSAVAELTPAGRPALPLAADGSLLAEIPSENVVVDIYLDPMCPICAQFATTIEPELLAMDGVTVVYRPISFLDRASSDGSYSTRAASAIQEVAARAPERLGAFLDQLWEHQPAEGSTLSDAQLVDLASAAGVPSEVSGMFAQHRFADAVAQATADATTAGLVGVPTVYIDGTAYDSSQGEGWDGVVPQVEKAWLERQVVTDLLQTPASSTVPATVSATAPAYGDVPATASASAPASGDPSVSPAP